MNPDASDDELRRAWFRRQILPLEADLKTYARRFSPSVQMDVEDLVNETFARAISFTDWRSVERPQAFARRILRNVAIDEIRHNKVVDIQVVADFDGLGIVDESADPERVAVSRDELSRLRAIVEALPTQMRRVFTLKRLYDMSTLAVADRLGISTSTVEKHLTRALRLCSDELAREPEPPKMRRSGQLWARTPHRDGI